MSDLAQVPGIFGFKVLSSANPFRPWYAYLNVAPVMMAGCTSPCTRTSGAPRLAFAWCRSSQCLAHWSPTSIGHLARSPRSARPARVRLSWLVSTMHSPARARAAKVCFVVTVHVAMTARIEHIQDRTGTQFCGSIGCCRGCALKSAGMCSAW